MCRIAGIYDPNQNIEQLGSLVEQMCLAMRKGGPDGHGLSLFSASQMALGHRRLALIDLSDKAKQPLHYQDRYCISYNGEVYNYPELRKELIEKGLELSSNSDTEVIIAGYALEGEAFFKKLRGMFAFALHDQANKITHLVRDQFGIKPLYYFWDKSKLIFASEVKAFKAYNKNWEKFADWPIYFLSFGFVPEPFTTLKNVNSLQKGHILSIDHQQNTINICPISSSEEQIFEHKSDTAYFLNRAVKRHLLADAPIGVFLSGGIDSSLISLIAAASTKESINTISINFEETAFTEEQYQQLIAKQIKSQHHSIRITAQDFEQHIDQIFEDMDQPSNDGVNSWFVCKAAKEIGLKAVLSGLGADELCGGYPSFKRYKLINQLKKLPKAVLRLFKYLPHPKLARISFLAYSNPIGEYLFLRGFFTPKRIALLLNSSEKRIEQLLADFPLPNSIEGLTKEERISWLETNLYMQNQLLKDTDYMSMAHGIEVRVPFLDQDFVHHLKQLPNEKRFVKDKPKGVLIDAYKDTLPQAIWDRPKKGFTFPFQTWFQTFAPFQNSENFSSNPEALKLLQEFKKGQLHWSKLFAVYQVLQAQKDA